jgi:N-acetylneuraminic acid mutarotase
MPTARTELAAAAIGGKLYAVGGRNGNFTALNTLEVYDPATNAWTAKAGMPTARYALAAAAINGKLYVVGGINSSSTVVKTLEVYDPATNAWTTKAELAGPPRFWLAAAAIGGKLYAVGGRNDVGVIGTPLQSALMEYDPATNAWTEKAGRPGQFWARAGLAAAEIDGKLYAVGGKDGSNTIGGTLEVYDPPSNAWTIGRAMPTRRWLLAGGAINGKLHAVGGSNTSDVTVNTLEVYDPATTEWTARAGMPTARHWLAAAVIDGTLYTVGGSKPGGLSVNTLEAYGPLDLTVRNTNDSGAGSLRQVITTANANATGVERNDIVFDSTVFGRAQTITLLSPLPSITSSLAIPGPGANLLTVRRDPSAAAFRIFDIAGGVTSGVAISGMTITGGSAGGNYGGGIFSYSNLTLTDVHVTGNSAAVGGAVALTADGTFTGCTFSGNTASQGGAINYQGSGGRTLRLLNSTVSGNSAANNAGGIINVSFSGNNRLEVTNSTIANNTTGGGGGGILTSAQEDPVATATTTLRNSIIANNTPNNLGSGTAGGGAATVQTLGFNLANDNGGGFLTQSTDKTNAFAGLVALANNGGPTPTHALLGTSAALDAGNNSGSGTSTDQRGAGFPRTIDLAIANAAGSDGSDIGAFEAQTTPASPPSPSMT